MLWDSHPLTLGATPLQVFIDGIAQLDDPYTGQPLSTSTSAPSIASMPKSPLTLDDDNDGLPSDRVDLGPTFLDEVFFTNVSEVLVKSGSSLESLTVGAGPFSVHIKAGEVVCAGQCDSASPSARSINLLGGSILPPLVGFGPALGLVDIISESSTKDAAVYDPLLDGDLSQTQQLWGPTVAVRAIDGLGFAGKHLKVAHLAGVTKAVTAPLGDGFFRGVSVAFRTNAANSASLQLRNLESG